MTRIIIAASTESEVLISRRFIISARTPSSSCVETMTESVNAAVPSSSERFLLCSTKPVSALLALVISMPTSVAAKVSTTMETMSPALRHSARYLIRSAMPSFFSGSGR